MLLSPPSSSGIEIRLNVIAQNHWLILVALLAGTIALFADGRTAPEPSTSPAVQDRIGSVIRDVEAPLVPAGDGVIDGTVLGPDGTPLTGVRLVATVSPWNDPSGPAPDPLALGLDAYLRAEARRFLVHRALEREATTDAAGRFTFRGLADLNYDVRSAAPTWWVEDSFSDPPVDVSPGLTLELTATAARPFDVRVFDRNGSRVPVLRLLVSTRLDDAGEIEDGLRLRDAPANELVSIPRSARFVAAQLLDSSWTTAVKLPNVGEEPIELRPPPLFRLTGIVDGLPPGESAIVRAGPVAAGQDPATALAKTIAFPQYVPDPVTRTATFHFDFEKAGRICVGVYAGGLAESPLVVKEIELSEPRVHTRLRVSSFEQRIEVEPPRLEITVVTPRSRDGDANLGAGELSFRVLSSRVDSATSHPVRPGFESIQPPSFEENPMKRESFAIGDEEVTERFVASLADVDLDEGPLRVWVSSPAVGHAECRVEPGTLWRGSVRFGSTPPRQIRLRGAEAPRYRSRLRVALWRELANGQWLYLGRTDIRDGVTDLEALPSGTYHCAVELGFHVLLSRKFAFEPEVPVVEFALPDQHGLTVRVPTSFVGSQLLVHGPGSSISSGSWVPTGGECVFPRLYAGEYRLELVKPDLASHWLGVVELSTDSTVEAAPVDARVRAVVEFVGPVGKKLGLRVGDEVVSVDGTPLARPQDWDRAVLTAPSGSMGIEVRRQGDPLELDLDPIFGLERRLELLQDTKVIAMPPRLEPVPR